MAGQGRSGMPLWVAAGLLLAMGLRLAVSQRWGPFADPAPATRLVTPPLPGDTAGTTGGTTGGLTRLARVNGVLRALTTGSSGGGDMLPPPEELFKKDEPLQPLPLMRLSIETGTIPVSSGGRLMPLSQFQHIAQLFGPIRDQVNEVVPLEKELVLHFKRCKQVNAYYSPVTDDITVCSELIDTFERAFAPLPADKREDAVQGATLFSTAHELGHALIARLKLPAVGGEEQAADQFALLLLQQRGPEGTTAALNAAIWMSWMADHRDPKEPMVFWDEHKLDAQRFFDMLCLAYGSDPFGRVNIVSDGHLPGPRAAKCGGEYQKMKSAWKTLLDPKLRKPL